LSRDWSSDVCSSDLGLADAGKYWHSDLSYKEIPSLGSMLHAQELPAEGGDTLFASQQAAYEALSQEVKQTLAGQRAAHSYLARYDDEVFAGKIGRASCRERV